MVKLTIQTSSHAYDVSIGEGLIHAIPKLLKKSYASALIVTDSVVATHYLADVEKSLSHLGIPLFTHVVPSGEKSKSIEEYYKVQTKAIECGLNRNSLIVALGGGVIGDLAGFVAATFMRGIDYIQVPTTILAHDSSVGGKVAINHELGKNLIGSFYPPRAVIYDVDTLNSLPSSEVRSGYAELIKEAFISDDVFLKELFSYNLEDIDNESLVRHLEGGVRVKAKIVQADEKESGIRAYLNLGHTLGHAIEATIGYGQLTHGEAIAIGMIFALSLSENYYKNSLPIDTYVEWLKKNDYPIELDGLTADDLLEKMKSDKKVTNDTIPMILLKDIGQPEIIPFKQESLRIELELFLKELVNL